MTRTMPPATPITIAGRLGQRARQPARIATAMSASPKVPPAANALGTPDPFIATRTATATARAPRSGAAGGIAGRPRGRATIIGSRVRTRSSRSRTSAARRRCTSAPPATAR